MALPLRYVDEIHARLMVRYGSAWTAKWAGFDATMMQAVKADWSNELDGMSSQAIRKALDSLPDDFPPTATAFRKLGAIRHEATPSAVLLPAPVSPNAASRAAQVRAHFGIRQKSQSQESEA